jgi:hypothetical protein
MLKLGVVRREQYRSKPTGLRERLRAIVSKNRISFQLLETATTPDDESRQLFEQLMSQICLSGGIKRTTFRGRFLVLDRSLNRVIANRFPHDSVLNVHDWAASDCVTSVEWARSLFEMFPKARLTASDLNHDLLAIAIPGRGTFITERSGEALQYVWGPFVIRLMPPEPKALIVNYVMYRLVMRQAARIRSCLAQLAESLDGSDDWPATRPFRIRHISMIHPDALALQNLDSRFSIARHSVFEPLAEPADVIRTMNIFNRTSFPPERLIEGARAVRCSLKPGGLWIVGRTSNKQLLQHDVSVFEHQAGGFRLVERFAGGSEIEDLALKFV